MYRTITKMDRLLEILKLTQSNATCIKQKTGCIIIDKKFNIISTGYNGTPSGMPHCEDTRTLDSHYSWDEVHAEVNAIAKAFPPNSGEARYMLTTHKPCMSCCHVIAANKAKLNIEKVFFIEDYNDKRYGNNQEEFLKMVKIKLIKLENPQDGL